MAISDTTKIDKNYKVLQGIAETSTNKAYYEETRASQVVMHASDVWGQDIATHRLQYTLYVLTEDPTVGSGRAWLASSVPGNASAPILRDWVPPSYDDGITSYRVRIYENTGTEIFPPDPVDWIFDYNSGVLYLQNGIGTKVTPLLISGWRYVGDKVSDVLADTPTLQEVTTAGNTTDTTISLVPVVAAPIVELDIQNLGAVRGLAGINVQGDWSVGVGASLITTSSFENYGSYFSSISNPGAVDSGTTNGIYATAIDGTFGGNYLHALRGISVAVTPRNALTTTTGVRIENNGSAMGTMGLQLVGGWSVSINDSSTSYYGLYLAGTYSAGGIYIDSGCANWGINTAILPYGAIRARSNGDRGTIEATNSHASGHDACAVYGITASNYAYASAIKGEANNGAIGVFGYAPVAAVGVYGYSDSGSGVVGQGNTYLGGYFYNLIGTAAALGAQSPAGSGATVIFTKPGTSGNALYLSGGQATLSIYNTGGTSGIYINAAGISYGIRMVADSATGTGIDIRTPLVGIYSAGLIYAGQFNKPFGSNDGYSALIVTNNMSTATSGNNGVYSLVYSTNTANAALYGQSLGSALGVYGISDTGHGALFETSLGIRDGLHATSPSGSGAAARFTKTGTASGDGVNIVGGAVSLRITNTGTYNIFSTGGTTAGAWITTSDGYGAMLRTTNGSMEGMRCESQAGTGAAARITKYGDTFGYGAYIEGGNITAYCVSNGSYGIYVTGGSTAGIYSVNPIRTDGNFNVGGAAGISGSYNFYVPGGIHGYVNHMVVVGGIITSVTIS